MPKNDSELKLLFQTGDYPPQSAFEAFIEGKRSLYTDFRSPTAATQTLTASDLGDISFDPSANHDVVLDDSFKKGLSKIIRNRGLFVLTIKANDSTEICKILPKGNVVFAPTIDSPTTYTQWVQLEAAGGNHIWVPSFTNLSPTNVTARGGRDGEYLCGEFKFIGGGGSPAEARMGLPSNLLTASNYPIDTFATNIIGDAAINFNSSEAIYILAEPSKSYVTFGLQNGANQGVVSINGDVLDPYTISGFFKVRIGKWNLN